MEEAQPAVLTDGLELGYIRIWRKIADSAVFQNPHLLQLWVWCLLRANRKPRTVPVKTGRGETLVQLQPGQFIFGRHAAGKALKCPPSTIRNRIRMLQDLGNVDIKPDTHYSVVTVINWEFYQGGDFRAVRQTATQKTKGNGAEKAPAKAPRKKHAVYTMSTEEYAAFVNDGIARIQGNARKLEEWRSLCPAVDIENAILDAAGWLLDRTDTGEADRRPKLTAFVGGWIRREQTRGGRDGR